MATRALALREGIAPIRDRLLATLSLAALLHGIIILGLTFGAAGQSGTQAPGLQVLIVSDEVPETDRNDDAQYLAQRTQKGSGTTLDAVAPGSPAAPEPSESQEGDPDGTANEQLAASSAAGDEELLATLAPRPNIRYFATLGAGPNSARPVLRPDRNQAQPNRLDDADELALRGKRREELWITPDTRISSVAPYLDAWRRKMERLGTINYPRVAREVATQKHPVIAVAIGADGQLISAVIRRSSGRPELDQAALGILKLGSPFDPFPKELAQRYELLRFAYEWQFGSTRPKRGVVTAPGDSQ